MTQEKEAGEEPPPSYNEAMGQTLSGSPGPPRSEDCPLEMGEETASPPLDLGPEMVEVTCRVCHKQVSQTEHISNIHQ